MSGRRGPENGYPIPNTQTQTQAHPSQTCRHINAHTKRVKAADKQGSNRLGWIGCNIGMPGRILKGSEINKKRVRHHNPFFCCFISSPRQSCSCLSSPSSQHTTNRTPFRSRCVLVLVLVLVCSCLPIKHTLAVMGWRRGEESMSHSVYKERWWEGRNGRMKWSRCFGCTGITDGSCR